MQINSAFNRSMSRMVVVGLVTWSGLAHANAWVFDDTHSAAEFTVKHMMVSNVRGQMHGIKGTVDIDDKDVTKSKVEVTLDATTINTSNEKRDAHLKSPDFFDVQKYPTVKFVSKKVEKSGDGLTVTGELTMHGVTKPAVLTVEGPTAAVKDPWGKSKRGFSASTKINRQDFGIKWNKTLDGGGIMVSDEVKIAIEGELEAKS